MDYQSFLSQKQATVQAVGFSLDPAQLHPGLRADQRDVVLWALRLGRAALFLDTGLGKTRTQLEWARHVAAHTGRPVLVLAPLAVAHQTVKEGRKIDLDVTYVRSQSACGDNGVYVTNYEMLDAFDTTAFSGVVLDESSILKAFSGVTRKKLQASFAQTPYRLCCTATPAPNDHMELSNHAEFLGVMTGAEMLARWFINDSMKAENYRLKHHARADFWRWVTSWAVCATKPSDLGHDDTGFDLPPLTLVPHIVEVDHTRAHADGQLFVNGTHSATGLWKEKKATAADRCAMAAELVLGALVWPGSPNTPATESAKPTKILSIVPGATPKGTAPTGSGDDSIINATTVPTPNDGSNSASAAILSVMPNDANDTPTIPNTVKSASVFPSTITAETPESHAIESFVTPSALALMTTSEYLLSKTDDARSVVQPAATAGTDDSTLITATKQGASEDCCAAVAISGSGTSATILPSLPTLSPTSSLPAQWVVWCDTNDEQDMLEAHFGDHAYSLRGADPIRKKEADLQAWLDGQRPILITKCDIFGYGMNWQHCTRMCFVGVTYSYEKLYQGLRRAWRYGQRNEVTAHLIYAESEGNVMDTITRKQIEHQSMQREMAQAQHGSLNHAGRMPLRSSIGTLPMRVPSWIVSEIAA